MLPSSSIRRPSRRPAVAATAAAAALSTAVATMTLLACLLALPTSASAQGGGGASAGEAARAGTAAGRPAQSVPASAIRAFELELAADVARDSVGSIAAAVFEGDEVVWRGAFGWSDRATGRLAGPATIYRAGSISKVVTALVLMRLVESGVVSLDGAVAEHVPELARLASRFASGPYTSGGNTSGGDTRAITFRDLATHTAGLSREPARGVHGRGPFLSWKRKVVASLPDIRVIAPPGEGYLYSNIGYALLGFALERAAGRPFEVLADSLVFRPLGMRSTSLVVSDDDRARLATGYVNLPGDTADPRVPLAEHRGRGYRVPPEGIYSTVGDLARLGMAVTGAAPIVADSLRLRMLEDASGAGYGIGLQVIDLGTVTIAGHSGRVPGYAAYLAVDPDRGTGVVLLRNYNYGATNVGAIASRLLLARAP